MVSFFHVFGFIGFVVSRVSWFHRFRGVSDFVVSWGSWCQRFHGFIGLLVSSSLRADVLWGLFVTRSFLPHGRLLNTGDIYVH